MKRPLAVLVAASAVVLAGCSSGPPPTPTPTPSSMSRDQIVDLFNKTLANDPRTGIYNNPFSHDQALKLWGSIADDIRNEGACDPHSALAYWKAIEDYDATLADAGKAVCREYLASVE